MATGRRANRRQTPVVFKRQKKSVLTEWGKIRSRRVTGLTVQQQRDVATVIKNAREMALLPAGSAGGCNSGRL